MQLAQEVQVVKRETEKNQTSAIFPAPAHSAEKNRSKVLQMGGKKFKTELYLCRHCQLPHSLPFLTRFEIFLLASLP